MESITNIIYFLFIFIESVSHTMAKHKLYNCEIRYDLQLKSRQTIW